MSEIDPVLSARYIFPSAIGTEQEIGMQDDTSGVMDEPHHFVRDLDEYIPKALLGYDDFLNNGFKAYAGGTFDGDMTTNLELATPECASPRQAAVYNQATQLLLVKMAREYISQTSVEMGRPINVRIQRRVTDSHGSRKACHDNYGMEAYMQQYSKKDTTNALIAHLATRSFVTGAGQVRTKRLEYAQKVGGISTETGYGYFGSMYRIDSSEEGQSRLEVRCNDINISDWATEIRIGTTALVLAINRTPLKESFNKLAYTVDAPSEAKWMNVLRLNPDGTLRDSPAQREAVRFQQHIAEFAMDKLQLYTDELPTEHFEIAKELHQYCEDYSKVLDGDETITLLADRADWAAKMSLIVRGMERDSQYGIDRKLTDFKSRAQDLRYDYIGIQGVDGQIVNESMGTGHKLHARAAFRRHISTRDIELAYLKAPTQTRAHLRAEILRKYPVKRVNWDYVTLASGQPNTHHIISLDDVLKTQFSDNEKEILSNLKQVRP